ncbi:MAG: helix-turn-helix transcriptional regulator [Rhodobacteraceae bacterium]|nr:helix-turn-helix transcriptional regulator [Paracoccaceae bacterium]
MIDAQTLASFTHYRRKHQNLTPSKLARKLKIPVSQIYACEEGKRIGTIARAALIKFNELEEV